MNTISTLKTLSAILATGFGLLWLSGCALIRPEAATDPSYVLAYQKERQFWEKRAAQVYSGMTRREVELILPPDKSLSGIISIATFVSAGKTRPQAHLEQWYYLSPHFICSIEYDFTGLNYEEPHLLLASHANPFPEFPVYSTDGSDPEENRELGKPTILLVKASRVKKRKS